MSIKSFLAKPFAGVVSKQVQKWSAEAGRAQEFVFQKLIQQGKNTAFGKEHGFDSIHSHQDFAAQVPVRDYEQLSNWIEKIKAGEENILWKGKPLYFAKTSGTTSGVKYIPITRDSIPNHINTTRNALLMYLHQTGNSHFIDGKMIFLSGSPEMESTNGILTGRLSGIVNHHVPKYLRGNQLPSFETNCIEEWETKVARIVEETQYEDLRLVSGIPPWIQMYFDLLLEKTGKKNVLEVFPNLSLLVYGGVNFEPYREKLFRTIGKEIDSVETYPASEGFIAFQEEQPGKGLLLNVDSGIFFEFIAAEDVSKENPARLTIDEVELGKNYALVLSNNAGLWAYLIGDTIKFVSLAPHRIVVTGRVKHFISAFGEHVIAEEVETALMSVAKKHNIAVTEFHVAPNVNPADGGKPFHEWFVEFDSAPADLKIFSREVDLHMRELNIYYRDLLEGNILRPLVMHALPKNSFIDYMKSKGKLGGQNKVPRLANDCSLAAELLR